MQDWVISRQLRSVPGVGDITSFGGKTKTYEIRVDPEKLASLGITPLDVFTAVQKTNINIGGDMIIQNDQAFVVRGIGLLNDISEIKNIIIQNINGVPVLVKDVAEVDISNLPRLGWVARADGLKDAKGNRIITDEPDAVEAIIVMRKGENPTKVIDAINAKIDKLNNSILPADTKIVPYYERSDLIEFATHTVLHNLVEGILLVTLLVSLFMFNWRTCYFDLKFKTKHQIKYSRIHSWEYSRLVGFHSGINILNGRFSFTNGLCFGKYCWHAR